MAEFDLNGRGMTSRRTRDRLVKRLREQGIHNEEVLAVIRNLPRHIFVDEALAHRAYEDTALPIGHGQTLSQPYIVALMTETLLNRPRSRILEIGTGSGYQAAVLAAMVGRVFSVERIQALIERAEKRFHALKLTNVHVKYDDGNEGWPEQAPFDGIIVTAAAAAVPKALLEQLEEDGRLVIPVGADDTQKLEVIDKSAEGFQRQIIDSVRFVPMMKGTTRT